MIAKTFILSRKQFHSSTAIGSAMAKTMLVLCFGILGTATAQSVVKVSSIAELQSALAQSGQQIIMKAKGYKLWAEAMEPTVKKLMGED